MTLQNWKKFKLVSSILRTVIWKQREYLMNLSFENAEYVVIKTNIMLTCHIFNEHFNPQKSVPIYFILLTIKIKHAFWKVKQSRPLDGFHYITMNYHPLAMQHSYLSTRQITNNITEYDWCCFKNGEALLLMLIQFWLISLPPSRPCVKSQSTTPTTAEISTVIKLVWAITPNY